MEKLKFNFTLGDDTELLKKMKEAYLACPAAVKYCKELGIPDEKIDKYITKVFDFVSDINYCKKCPGIKNCKKENAYLISKVDYHGTIVETTLAPCKEIIKRVAFEKQFQVRDFNDDLLDVSIRDIDKTSSRKEALQQYAEFVKGNANPWIYLTGGAGSGRSYFAAVMCVDAASRSMGPICFLNSAKRIRELSDLANKKGEAFQKELDKYCNARILVLDDFGNEFVNDFIRDTIIYPIISTRHNKNLMTIFTSDFTIDEIETLYSTSKAGQLRAKQICKIISTSAKKEINLGTLAIY